MTFSCLGKKWAAPADREQVPTVVSKEHESEPSRSVKERRDSLSEEREQRTQMWFLENEGGERGGGNKERAHFITCSW